MDIPVLRMLSMLYDAMVRSMLISKIQHSIASLIPAWSNRPYGFFLATKTRCSHLSQFG
jgi:hypothetical protein